MLKIQQQDIRLLNEASLLHEESSNPTPFSTMTLDVNRTSKNFLSVRRDTPVNLRSLYFF